MAGISVIDGVEREFDAGGDSQLFENAKQIFLDGVLAEIEFDGDLAIGKAFGDQRDDLLFTGREQVAASRVEHAQRGDFGDVIEDVVQLLGVGPDLSGGDTRDAFAEQAKIGVGEGKDSVHSGSEGADDELTIERFDQQYFRNVRMRAMKSMKDGNGFLCVDGRVERNQGNGGRAGVGRLKNRSGIERAVVDTEFGMAAQRARQQLGLHAVGIGDQHTNRLGSGGERLHSSPGVTR